MGLQFLCHAAVVAQAGGSMTVTTPLTTPVPSDAEDATSIVGTDVACTSAAGDTSATSSAPSLNADPTAVAARRQKRLAPTI